MIRPVLVMFLVGIALMLGGAAGSLSDIGDFVGARYGLSGFDGLVVLDSEFRQAQQLGNDESYPWYAIPVANWVVIFGLVLFVASIALAAAVRRPRPLPKKKREAATV